MLYICLFSCKNGAKRQKTPSLCVLISTALSASTSPETQSSSQFRRACVGKRVPVHVSIGCKYMSTEVTIV